MSVLLNDWRPETKSLLARLQAAGFKLLSVDNGEYQLKFEGDLDRFTDNLIACDESFLVVLHPNGAKRLKLWLVLGNEPGVIVCDYTAYDEKLDAVIDAHEEEWQDKPQPTRPGP